ncbi:MAG: DUF4230 domain-containing protein [Ruthenibacterium sp.]
MAEHPSDFQVKSTGSAVADEKAKETEKELAKMKARAAADSKRAKQAAAHESNAFEKSEALLKSEKKKLTAQQKTAKKKIDKHEKQLENMAMAAGGALLGTITSEKASKGEKKTSLLILIGIVVVVGIGFFFFRDQLAGLLGLKMPELTLPDTVQGLLPDEKMGYNKIDFSNAILGAAREKQELVVMEQDVQVDSEISNALANLDIFKKTKKIHSFGTGVYTVDMSKIDDAHIAVDLDKKTVTVTIPHTVLQYVNVDSSKTTFEDTEHSLLGFGDVTLTQEQQQELNNSVTDAMHKELDTSELFQKADEIGTLKVREIFQPLITAVAEDFIVKVVQ